MIRTGDADIPTFRVALQGFQGEVDRQGSYRAVFVLQHTEKDSGNDKSDCFMKVVVRNVMNKTNHEQTS